MPNEFVDNRYLTDLLSIVLGFDDASVKELSPEQQLEVFKHLHSARGEFDKLNDSTG
jgi:hypothetical protein